MRNSNSHVEIFARTWIMDGSLEQLKYEVSSIQFSETPRRCSYLWQPYRCLPVPPSRLSLAQSQGENGDAFDYKKMLTFKQRKSLFTARISLISVTSPFHDAPLGTRRLLERCASRRNRGVRRYPHYLLSFRRSRTLLHLQKTQTARANAEREPKRSCSAVSLFEKYVSHEGEWSCAGRIDGYGNDDAGQCQRLECGATGEWKSGHEYRNTKRKSEWPWWSCDNGWKFSPATGTTGVYEGGKEYHPVVATTSRDKVRVLVSS
jgi:hypothetical protein